MENAAISSFMQVINNHDHKDPCDHGELKFCARCDVVVCKKCYKEWKGITTQLTTWPQFTPIIPNQALGSSGNIALCQHPAPQYTAPSPYFPNNPITC